MTTPNTNAVLIHEPINEDYEWLQYNNHLRLIRSINDDMYQMNSILIACHSNKHADNWFCNNSTFEILDEFMKDEEFKNPDETSIFRLKMNNQEFRVNRKLIENRKNEAPKLKGYYVNRVLVNAVAMWASPRYSVMIFRLLDKIATEEREALENKVNELDEKVEEQKPRMVPEKKEKNYKYMIWKEEIPEEPEKILLHLVRRNNRVFSQVINIKNDPNKCWFYKENLPIAMTPNEDIKALVKKTLPGNDYKIKACTILTNKQHLPLLHEKITEYFENFQN